MENKKTLKAFLYENAIKKECVKYVASERFIDPETKEPMEWELAVLTNEEIEKIYKRHKKSVLNKGTRKYEVVTDQEAVTMEMTLNAVKFPALDDEELQNSWKAIGEEELLQKMLTPGELADLNMAVVEACGFEAGMKDKIKEIKNS